MNTALPLENQVTLITGGNRGIGRATALKAAASGAKVVLTYNTHEDEGEEVCSLIRDQGGAALAIQMDVSDRSAIRRTIAQAVDHFGTIDSVVNNAGLLQQKPFEQLTDEDWDLLQIVNLQGPFRVAQEVFPTFQSKGGGTIVNVSSIGGQIGGNLAVHYSAFKAGQISLTRSLARVGAEHSIRVNCVSPGLIETDMTAGELATPAAATKIASIPAARVGAPDEVASAIVFLLSSESSYITGEIMNVNGGLLMA